MLYRLVADNVESFLDHAREHHASSLPKYVEEELRAYLRCGIHAYGFLRARCKDCRRELLVAFSCKRRGVCPSCNARRMCGTAALLTDRVLPDVPLRQWVLSVPFELRLLLARDPRALSAVGRSFVHEILRWQRERAEFGGIRRSRGGAICFPQRFGGSLNLNVHYHVAVPDGVFTLAPGDERADFHRLAPPRADELETIAFNVEMRSLAWLRRGGLLADAQAPEDCSGATSEWSALDACLAGSLGVGELTALDGRSPATPDDTPALSPPPRAQRRGGHSRGFDVHAGVVVSGSDREGRERLLRYCSRPPLSLERLSVLPDGRVAYAIRKPWGRQTHRVMTPVEFLARLCAVIPPPRHPLIRFHGVFAPHSAWRPRVVPATPSPTVAPCVAAPAVGSGAATRAPVNGGAAAAPAATTDRVAPERQLRLATASARTALGTGAVRARASGGIPWAELLRRVYDVDALACPCGGRLRFIAVILEPGAAQAILESLGLPSRPRPVARARSPDLRDPIPDHW